MIFLNPYLFNFFISAGEDVSPSHLLLDKFEDAGGLVLNSIHRSEVEVAGHSD